MALATVATVQSAKVQPRITKSEAIKAMVERARQKHEQEADEYNQKRDALLGKIKLASIKMLKTQFDENSINDPEIKISGNWGDAVGMAELRFEFSGGELNALLKELKKLEKASPGWFRADDVEKKIRLSLDSTQERVALILADEQNVATIDSLLAKLK